MAFTIYLINPKDVRNPILVGNVNGESGREVGLAGCALIEQKFDADTLEGWGFEAIEFTGKKRQMAGVFRKRGT